MKIVHAKRQCGKTTWIVNKAIAQKQATIVCATNAEANMIRHMVTDKLENENSDKGLYDICVIPFEAFCSDIMTGKRHDNIIFDNLEWCVHRFAGRNRAKILAATISSENLIDLQTEIETTHDETGMVNIKGLNKAEVLLALWNRSHSQGMSFLGMDVAHPDIKTAEVWIEQNPLLDFDYVNGHIIKCNIKGDEFDPYLYDKDCGVGAAAAVIEKLRKSK